MRGYLAYFIMLAMAIHGIITLDTFGPALVALVVGVLPALTILPSRFYANSQSVRLWTFVAMVSVAGLVGRIDLALIPGNSHGMYWGFMADVVAHALFLLTAMLALMDCRKLIAEQKNGL